MTPSAAAAYEACSGPPAGPLIEQVMLAESLHRNANDMQIVQGHLHRAERAAPEAARHIDAAIAHVGRVADVQRLLIPPLSHGADVDLKAELEKVCLAMSRATLVDQGIGIRIAVDECALAARECWMITTIVVELVANAARHAFDDAGGTIVVAGRRDGRVLVIGVADNGTRAGTTGAKAAGRLVGGGRGTGIVAAALAVLGGTMRRSSGPEGTRVELWVGL